MFRNLFTYAQCWECSFHSGTLIAQQTESSPRFHLNEYAQLNKADAVLKKQDRLLDIAIENEQRHSKVITGWEKQQVQYQKYLDSLNMDE